MKRMTLAAIAAIVGTTSVVSARRVMPPARELAVPSVTGVSTFQSGTAMYRAISGIEGQRPYLVLEELAWARGNRGNRDPRRLSPDVIEPPDTRQNLDVRDRYDDRGGRRGTLMVRTQRPIIAVDIGGQRIDFGRFRSVNIEGWNNNRLIFAAVTPRTTYRCSVDLSDGSAPACKGSWIDDGNGGGYDGSGINPGGGIGGGNGGGYDGSGINPGGGSPNLERLKVVTKACASAFYDVAQRDNCIQQVMAGRVDLVPAVSACGQVFAGNAEKLSCITQSASFAGDSPAVIKQCARSFSGSETLLNCFRTMATQNLPLTVITACDSAISAPQDRLRCMSSLAGSRTEPVALVEYCKENNSGAENILRCIAKYK
jgi:hypothetical protein